MRAAGVLEFAVGARLLGGGFGGAEGGGLSARTPPPILINHRHKRTLRHHLLPLHLLPNLGTLFPLTPVPLAIPKQRIQPLIVDAALPLLPHGRPRLLPERQLVR